MKKQYKVMLVDDEKVGIQLIETLLLPYKSEFYVTARCHSVAEAKLALLQSKPDLIFLDIQMPEADGFDFVRDIRGLGIDTPFVFVTAYDTYMYKAFNVQPFDYLLKPVSPTELAEVLLRFKGEYARKVTNCAKLPQAIITDKGLEIVCVEDIIYITTERRKSCIYLKDDTITFTNKSLRQLLEVLPQNYFVKIQKGAVVNLKYVLRFSYPDLYIKTGKENKKLLIGRAYIKALKEKLDIQF